MSAPPSEHVPDTLRESRGRKEAGREGGKEGRREGGREEGGGREGGRRGEEGREGGGDLAAEMPAVHDHEWAELPPFQRLYHPVNLCKFAMRYVRESKSVRAC